MSFGAAEFLDSYHVCISCDIEIDGILIDPGACCLGTFDPPQATSSATLNVVGTQSESISASWSLRRPDTKLQGQKCEYLGLDRRASSRCTLIPNWKDLKKIVKRWVMQAKQGKHVWISGIRPSCFFTLYAGIRPLCTFIWYNSSLDATSVILHLTSVFVEILHFRWAENVLEWTVFHWMLFRWHCVLTSVFAGICIFTEMRLRQGQQYSDSALLAACTTDTTMRTDRGGGRAALTENSQGFLLRGGTKSWHPPV